MLSCLSYNIFFGKRLDLIIKWLTTLSSPFDIICFQEFPHAKIGYLQASFSPFDYVFRYATSFITRGQDYGQLTLIHKNIHLLESDILQFGKSFFEERVIKLKGERSSLLTALQYHQKPFLVANTHLLLYASNEQRRQHLSKVIDSLEKLSDTRNMLPVVILGDMNYFSQASTILLRVNVQKG